MATHYPVSWDILPVNTGGIHNTNSATPMLSVSNGHNSVFLNQQEISDLNSYLMNTFVNYGSHFNRLDQLQYKADKNFAIWYLGNYSLIPSASRGISMQNSTILLGMWKQDSLNAKGDLSAITTYEMNENTEQYNINTTCVVKDRLGTLISVKAITYQNESAYLMVYKFEKNNESLVYGFIHQNSLCKPVDPYIRMNAFTIHWGWFGIISGTSYNIYFTFDNYQKASNFKNFLTGASTILSSVNSATSILAWAAIGAVAGSVFPGAGTIAGAIVGVIGGIVSLIYDNTNPFTVAKTVNEVFNSEEAFNGEFAITYTLNAWEGGMVPEFSWWGYEYMNTGPVLTQFYKNVGLASGPEASFKVIYNALVDIYGTNNEVYLNAPSGGWLSFALTLSS
jgi:hypothetical protein